MNRKIKGIRAVLSRNGDTRTLLKIWNDPKNGYYSVAATEKRHRTYHTDGRFHTNVGRWGKYDHHRDVRLGTPTTKIQGIKILQCLVILNKKSHHENKSRFKEYTSKNKDYLVRVIDETMLDDGCIISVISGFGKNENEINKYFSSARNNEAVVILALDICAPDNLPPMFVAIIKGNSTNNESILSALIKISGIKKLFLPRFSYVLANGEDVTETITISFNNFGEPPPRLHESAPRLPLKAKEGAPEYTVELVSSPFESKYFEVENLSLKALHPQHITSQIFLIAATRDLHKSLTIHYPQHGFVLSSFPRCLITLEAGEYGGHYEKQVNIGGKNYQIEVSSPSLERIDATKEITDYNLASNYIISYTIKIIDLTLD